MDVKTKYDKQTAQFRINVNNIVVMLLENKVFITPGSVTQLAVNLIKEKFGFRERQAKHYLSEARKEILKTTETLKQIAIQKAIDKGELS